MSYSIFDPSLGFLILKIIYFLVIIYLTGWAIYPDPVFKQSRVASWVFRQSLGTGLLLLIGFNMVSFDIPGKWILLVPHFIIYLRLILNTFKPRKYVAYSETADSFSRSLRIYALGSAVIAIIYILPFILLNSSGLYAYGGGDHSSYFRVSDLVIDKSLKDLMMSWGLAWPPTTNYVSMTATSSMFPPVQNWSINSFLFYIKYARQSMTFANQTIGVPFIGLGFINPEESYTAGVTVYLLLLCWSAAIFTATIIRKIGSTWVLALSACAVAVASPAMSLVLKQTIPAVYSWGSMLLFLSVMIYRDMENKKTLRNSFAFGVSMASTYLMYLPAIIVSGPLWAYLFIKGLRHSWLQKFKWALIVLFIVLVSANIEIDRPVLLFLSNATGAILDYGLKLSYIPVTLFGVADFETVLDGVISYPMSWAAGLVIFIGLLHYIKRANYPIVLVFTIPILLSIAYYWHKGGHYHVIRMVEFVGVVFIAMSIAGFVCAYRTTSTIHKFFIVGLVCVFVANAVSLKKYIDKKVISSTPDSRAGIATANDIKLARSLERQFSNSKSKPIIYWMRWGTVPFANHEIIFRNLRYVEAFEYDYSYVKMDILDPQYLNNALLIYPKDNIRDILQIKPNAFSSNTAKLEDKVVQSVGKGSGAAILGTGWLAPTIEKGEPVRYLRSAQEAGLVVWSDKQKAVQVEIEASGVEPGMFLTLRRPELENNVFSNDKSILRGESETSQHYVSRIEKNMDLKKGADMLYFLKTDIDKNMKLGYSKFNAKLLKSRIFKQFVIYNIEDESAFTKNLENNYHAQQLTYKLNDYHDNSPTVIKFNLALHKGANIIRFISRDSKGRRSGRDVLTGVFYHSDAIIPYVVLNKIEISPVSGKLMRL